MSGGGARAEILVHPQATLGSDCRLGPGTILNAGARVTTNITTGRHVQVHCNATIGHDATLGDYVSVFPGATVSGSVVLEDGVTVVVGQGYVGLPVAVRASEVGFPVVGFDLAGQR
jgi:UDP-3-O-[3-hydroxymyristoyl] glucosamine N-acyltransferase